MGAAGRNVSNADESDQQEGLQDVGDGAVFGDPSVAGVGDVVFHTSGFGVEMQVESPVEVVLGGWVVTDEEDNVQVVC